MLLMEETTSFNGPAIRVVKEGKRRGHGTTGWAIAGGAAWTRGSAGRGGKRRGVGLTSGVTRVRAERPKKKEMGK